MTDTSPAAIEAFNYQCERNLSHVGKARKTVVAIGQQHLKDQFIALAAERDAMAAQVAVLRGALETITTGCAEDGPCGWYVRTARAALQVDVDPAPADVL